MCIRWRIKELDTGTSVETEEKYQWMFLCCCNFSTENKRGFIALEKLVSVRKISSAMQCIKTKVGRSLNVDSDMLNDEALKFKNEIWDKARFFDKMIELPVAKGKTVIWCFRTLCIQGSQIVFGKRNFSCARTKKGQVFACWYGTACGSILPRWWIYSTRARQERLH